MVVSICKPKEYMVYPAGRHTITGSCNFIADDFLSYLCGIFYIVLLCIERKAMFFCA